MPEQEIVDTPEQPEVKEDRLFFYDGEAEGVDEPQDTTQEEVTAESEVEGKQDSPEEEETATHAETEEEEVAEVEQSDSPSEEKSPKQDPDAFQYWQSVAQKYEGKLGVKPDEISDEEVQLFNTFRNHPEYLQQFAEYVTNGPKQQQVDDSPKEEGPKTLQRPEKPVEPAGYDPYAAINDPESDSYQHRLAKEKYLEDLAEYAEKKADSTREELTEREKQKEAQAKAQQVKRQWYTHLTENEGLTDEQFQDFWGWREKQQFEPQEIITMYKAVRGIGDKAESDKIDEREKQLKERQQRKKKHAPSPATTAGAGEQATSGKGKKREEQLFAYR